MYYALIMLSVVMFGGTFALKDVYRKQRGGGLKISLEFSLVGAVAGLVVLTAINGFSFQFTWFALLLATLAALNNLAFSFCSFRALGTINLSMYSLFSMLGGMLLPFFQGILFFHEEFTVSKAVCLAFICAALLLTLKKGETKKSGRIYYLLVFIFNGMSGVLSKIFAAAPAEWKTMASGEPVSAAGYSVLSALCTLVLTSVLLLTLYRGKPYEKEQTKKGLLIGTVIGLVSGPINRLANWILQVALEYVDASVQYPMVTGGTMIVSTVICFFTRSKPKAREVVSVVLAFLGLTALFVFPTFLPTWDKIIFKI